MREGINQNMWMFAGGRKKVRKLAPATRLLETFER